MFAKPRPKKSPLPPAPSKKRKAVHAIEELNFDNSARAEYLTGFHKRKLQRQKHAQEEAAKRAREERIKMRRELREERKQAVEEHVKSVEALLKESKVAGLDSGDEGTETGSENGDDEEWGGIEEAPPPPALEPVDRQEEYVDEDLYTTVKIEAVSVDRDGLHNKADLESENGEDMVEQKKRKIEAGQQEKAKKDHPKTKKKKFRYETKYERQASNRKSKAKKAARFG